MAEWIESSNLADVVKFELSSHLSREVVTVLAGSGASRTLRVGEVIGRRTVNSATVSAQTGNSGNGTSSAVTLGLAAQAGIYILTCISASSDAGTFKFQKPDGGLLSSLTVANAYASDHINLTLSDGTNDFVVGDKFYVTVGDGKVAALDVNATDGTQIAAGIMGYETTAIDGVDNKGTAIVRDALLSQKNLVWPVGITEMQKAAAIAQLANRGFSIQQGA